MFTTKKIKLGILHVGKETTVEFPYTDIKVIYKTESPCSCSVPSVDIVNKKVIVKYTPNPVPAHLALQGRKSYESEKKIKVYYLDLQDNPQLVTLTFTATIV